MTGGRCEAAEIAALSTALHLPNTIQGVYGDRVRCRIIEERLFQILAARLSNEAPNVPERKDSDAVAESRLDAITNAAGGAAGAVLQGASDVGSRVVQGAKDAGEQAKNGVTGMFGRESTFEDQVDTVTSS